MDSATTLPPSIDKALRRFESLGREEKMQALLSYARKLPAFPERFREQASAAIDVPECTTPLRLFPEVEDGKLRFHAQIDTRQSPTVAAFLAILFSAVNDQPPETTLAIPADFVRRVMQSIGLGTREVGLEAIVARLKRFASEAIAARDAGPGAGRA
jgi:cysteine desulfuration protein SufE